MSGLCILVEETFSLNTDPIPKVRSYRKTKIKGKKINHFSYRGNNIKKVVNVFPSLLGHAKTIKKICIIIGKNTVEKKVEIFNKNLRTFELIKQAFSSCTQRYFFLHLYFFGTGHNIEKKMDQKFLFRGLIRYESFWMDFSATFKNFGIHANLHDFAGFVKPTTKKRTWILLCCT